MEHRIGLAGRSVNTALESKARAIFRWFTPGIFYEAHREVLSHKDKLIDELKFNSRLPMDEESQKIYDRYPDVIALRDILWHLDSDTVLRKEPEWHRMLLNSPDESVESMIRGHVGLALSLAGPYNRLRLAITAAFTPKEERSNVQNAIRKREGRRIIDNVSDLSSLRTPEERLGAIIRLLSFTHEEAAVEVCVSYEINPLELGSLRESNTELFSKIHSEAGLLYSRESLYGILSDQEHGGADSAFKVIPGLDSEEPKTDAKQCPGAPYARNFYLGVGNLLKDNFNTVLGVIKTWDYYKDGNVRRFSG